MRSILCAAIVLVFGLVLDTIAEIPHRIATDHTIDDPNHEDTTKSWFNNDLSMLPAIGADTPPPTINEEEIWSKIQCRGHNILDAMGWMKGSVKCL